MRSRYLVVPSCQRCDRCLQLILTILSNFVCPSVLKQARNYSGMAISIESYLDKGTRANGHLELDRRLMASSLADLVHLGVNYPEMESIPTNNLFRDPGSVWPKPHNVLFNFDQSKKGAGWIDQVGEKYLPFLEASHERLVIGHLDWGAKHCRIDNDRISAIYDWDSVARVPEERVLGSAAASFTTSWYVEGRNRPMISEVMAFISDYLNPSKTTEIDVELLSGMIYYAAGYGARCEHAIANKTDRKENRDFLSEVLSSDLVRELSGRVS